MNTIATTPAWDWFWEGSASIWGPRLHWRRRLIGAGCGRIWWNSCRSSCHKVARWVEGWDGRGGEWSGEAPLELDLIWFKWPESVCCRRLSLVKLQLPSYELSWGMDWSPVSLCHPHVFGSFLSNSSSESRQSWNLLLRSSASPGG